MASTNSEIKRQPKTLAVENRGICDSQFSATASSEVNNNKQIAPSLFDFAENISSCSAPNDNLKIQMGQIHENLVGSNSNSKPRQPTLPRNRPTTLVDMMQFVKEWFDFEERENASCNASVVYCGNSVREKIFDCFDVVKNEEGNDKIKSSISGNFTQLEAEALDVGVVMKVHIEPTNQVDEETKQVKLQLEEPTIETIVLENFVSMSHVLVGQIVSTLGIGFENLKTKRARLRQWRIAWSFPAFRWTIVLVPFWI
ncbi:hypothetical protein Dsin_032390 [Dipteronia sinensis]|uniref:Uncharacterized protein n=1 Tax=Dipteronia sinensis TaxID=43782 RepID=A0AAE0DT89_9ROSI|nr:hypothetical protein Dsin_032390 [Dipteronia sinensis]